MNDEDYDERRTSMTWLSANELNRYMSLHVTKYVTILNTDLSSFVTQPNPAGPPFTDRILPRKAPYRFYYLISSHVYIDIKCFCHKYTHYV